MKRILSDMVHIIETNIKTIKDAGRISLMAITTMVVIPALAATQDAVIDPATIATITPIETTHTTTEIQTVASWHDLQVAYVEIQGEDIASISGDYEEAEAIAEAKDEIIPEVVAELAQETPFTFDPELPFGYSIAREVVAEVSAYNPLPEQTDSTPCITASNKNICDGEHAVIAANWLKFGTKVMIPEYFGDTVFTVEDRMNPRYPYNVDVLFYDKGEARTFGRRKLLIQVLEESEVQIASR